MDSAVEIRKLSDSELLRGVKKSVSEERKYNTQVLEFLREIDRRRLYADSGYPSLWDFCTKELGYSVGSASRRIASMRLLRDLPELKDDLLSGKQNFSSLAQAYKFFRVEEKYQEKKFSPEQKREVLNSLEGKTSRECERELLKISSVPIELSRPERKRLLDEKHTELSLVLNAELLAKLDRIRELRSHATPSTSYTEILEYMADEILKKIDPVRKKPSVIRVAAKNPPTSESKRVRIPVATRTEVWSRDRGRCGFVDPETGRECNSRYFLELDHIIPVALGGSNHPSNLRLRCRGHNQRSAVQIFGPRSA